MVNGIRGLVSFVTPGGLVRLYPDGKAILQTLSFRCGNTDTRRPGFRCSSPSKVVLFNTESTLAGAWSHRHFLRSESSRPAEKWQ